MALGDPYVTVGTGAGASITTEAVLVTLPLSSSTSEGGQGNYLTGVVQLPNAVATGVVTVKIRQNTLTGTTVGTAGPYTVGTAAAGANVTITGLDAAAASTGVQTYVLTVTGSGGTLGTGILGTLSVTPAGVSN
jgi:hypothetical protein